MQTQKPQLLLEEELYLCVPRERPPALMVVAE
jgi:hypothetical protein